MEYPDGRMIQFGGIKNFVIQCVNILLLLENREVILPLIALGLLFSCRYVFLFFRKKPRIVFVATMVAHLLGPAGFIEQLQERITYK